MDKKCRSRVYQMGGNVACGKAGGFATKANPRVWMCKEHFDQHIKLLGLRVKTVVIGI
jgi:hypothetical protein